MGNNPDNGQLDNNKERIRGLISLLLLVFIKRTVFSFLQLRHPIKTQLASVGSNVRWRRRSPSTA